MRKSGRFVENFVSTTTVSQTCSPSRTMTLMKTSGRKSTSFRPRRLFQTSLKMTMAVLSMKLTRKLKGRSPRIQDLGREYPANLEFQETICQGIWVGGVTGPTGV